MCVDCWEFDQRIAAKGERCDAHRAAYRRWYQANWKAKKDGRASGQSAYVAERVRVDRVYVSPDVVMALEQLNRELDIATRMLSHNIPGLTQEAMRRVVAARTRVATSSTELEGLVRRLKGERRMTLAVREKGARRSPSRPA
jgi:predicted DNA-binding helix-hairpin-helix protein